ncbi:MAG: hypothetical protein ACR2OR_02380, partial [Hyphomicrobiales bacterium]
HQARLFDALTATGQLVLKDVRFGSKADIRPISFNVRFCGESGRADLGFRRSPPTPKKSALGVSLVEGFTDYIRFHHYSSFKHELPDRALQALRPNEHQPALQFSVHL